MKVKKQLWTIKQLREQLSVFRGERAPSLLLKNCTYLNAGLKRWLKADIWIDGDRIIYVGDRVPPNTEGTDIVDCEGQYLVPGYIEPHVHPEQLYNPHTLMKFAANTGTTTLISDNFNLFSLNDDELAFDIIDKLDQEPVSMFWWCRYDPQTPLNDQELFNDERITKWLAHPSVIQGGELTAWPQVLHGDDEILKWMQETKALGKPIEGHLPGASDKTLTQMILLGVDCDHEAMTGEEAIRRMQLGLTTSLRYSSIRPDLPKILEAMLAEGVTHFDRVYMTTDGSTPAFLENGLMDHLIKIALEKGVPEIDAYLMASFNIANHYHMVDQYGAIAPGRLAHINFLSSPKEPTPVSVLAKGQWVKRHHEPRYPETGLVYRELFPDWSIDWEPKEEHLELSGTVGIDMVNSVIAKPFNIERTEFLPEDCHYLSLVDKNGKWTVNTIVKGFASDIPGFASSYSLTGDIFLIGKNYSDMIAAFNHMKKLGGGIVLVENGEIANKLELPILGRMSQKPIELLIRDERMFRAALEERGYHFEDPVYSLLFFSSTHLPYIRITQKGLVDVMRERVLIPPQQLF